MQNQHLQKYIQNSSIGLVQVNNQLLVTWYNNQAKKLLGLNNNQKFYFKEFLHEVYHHRIDELFFSNQDLSDKEFILKNINNDGIPARISISKMDDVNFIIEIFDLSILKQTEEKLFETTERINAIIATAVDGIININQRGIIENINPAALKLFGYTIDEVMGQNIKMLMPEPDRSLHDGYLENFRKTRKPKIIGIGREVVAQKKDGTLFPISLGVSEVKLYNRTIYTGIIHDLTPQKNVEEELRALAENLEKIVEARTEELNKAVEKLKYQNKKLENEIERRIEIEEALHDTQKMYAAITSNFPNGSINIFDKELRYIFSDGKELKELGYDHRFLSGVKLLDHLSEEEGNVFKTHLKKVFEGRLTTFDVQIKKRFFKIYGVPLEDRTGNINQIMVVGQNITEQKLSEEKIKKSLEKERELNELKSRFVSMASHEFRTPLASILSSISLIDRYREAGNLENQQKHILRIKSNVSLLIQILNDFLSIGKLEEGKVGYKAQPVLVENVIEETIEDIQQTVKKGQTIIFNNEIKGLTFKTDPKVLKNILFNLLSNASKYSPENKNIFVTTRVENKSLIFSVKDNGFGIPPDEQKMLFDRFFRASNVSNVQGTGLGLNIVKKYIELMKGTITFTSKLNEGTTFVVEIPKALL